MQLLHYSTLYVPNSLRTETLHLKWPIQLSQMLLVLQALAHFPLLLSSPLPFLSLLRPSTEVLTLFPCSEAPPRHWTCPPPGAERCCSASRTALLPLSCTLQKYLQTQGRAYQDPPDTTRHCHRQWCQGSLGTSSQYLGQHRELLEPPWVFSPGQWLPSHPEASWHGYGAGWYPAQSTSCLSLQGTRHL